MLGVQFYAPATSTQCSKSPLITGHEAGMAPEPISVLSRTGQNPMPRTEPRFYDFPGRIVMTLLTAVLRIFTTTEELNKKCNINIILLVRVCIVQLVLTAYAP